MNPFNSSIGMKVLMAITGLAMFLFVIGHLVGNLQVFIGQEAVNSYAEFLQHGTHGIIWILRAALLAILALHVIAALRLKVLNYQARPVKYANKGYREAGYTTRTILYTGILVFAFIAFHLAHFTFKCTHPDIVGAVDAHGRFDVFSMVVRGFSDPVVTVTYVIAMAVLAFHLSHAAFALFQTLGVSNPRYERTIHAVAPVVATLIALAYISIPVGILLGVVQLPEGVAL
jgi:succinate dehydrogenase / fumarate reductase cytochrome b subunit